MRVEIKRNGEFGFTSNIELDGLKPVVIDGVPVEYGMEYPGTNTDEFMAMMNNSDEADEITSKVMDIMHELSRLDNSNNF